jgi:hypothetical protein
MHPRANGLASTKTAAKFSADGKTFGHTYRLISVIVSTSATDAASALSDNTTSSAMPRFTLEASLTSAHAAQASLDKTHSRATASVACVSVGSQMLFGDKPSVAAQRRIALIWMIALRSLAEPVELWHLHQHHPLVHQALTVDLLLRSRDLNQLNRGISLAACFPTLRATTIL